MRLVGLASSLVASIGLALGGCAEDADDDLTFVVPTEIAVEPADFLGDTPCSSFEGAVQSYVVTLQVFDDADDTTGITLGSSFPTPCSAVAGFRNVIVIGKRYTATIDAYGVPAAALTPYGGTASGSRQMLLEGAPVAPRWTTSCGGPPEEAPMAALNERVFVRPCLPLEDSGMSPTALAIGAADVLGDDACSIAPAIDIEIEGGALPPVIGLACDAAPVVYEAEPGVDYDIYATALVEGVLYGALCQAEGIAGLTVRPSCNPPSPHGHATIALGGLGEPPVCPVGHSFDLFRDGELLNDTPLPCAATASLGPFDPGVITLDATIYDAGGAVVATAGCAVEIEPGKTKRAVCLPD